MTERDVTAHIDDVIAQLERVREGLCCYYGTTCDCKYGFPTDRTPGTEQTGCPEIRAALGLLRQFRKLLTTGEPLLTWQEWSDCDRILKGVTQDSIDAAKRQEAKK